jgi:hypothetical protein
MVGCPAVVFRERVAWSSRRYQSFPWFRSLQRPSFHAADFSMLPSLIPVDIIRIIRVWHICYVLSAGHI